MNRQKIMANRRRDIIIIVGCTILALIGGYGWSRGFGNFTWFRNFDTPGTASVDDAVLNYEPLIQQYAKEYGIESYVPVIEALMLSLIHISEPTRPDSTSRMPSSA